MASTIDTRGIEMMYSALDTQSLRENASSTALSSGITLMQKKRYKEAATAFKQAAAFSPTNTDAYNFMAQAYINLGDNKKAIEAYKLSIKIYAGGQSTGVSGATQDDTQVNLASIYIQEKRPADAEKVLRDAMRVNPRNVVAPYTLGQVLMQQDRVKEAEDLFRRAVKLSPTDGNAYYGLGTALNKEGKAEDAIKTLQKAVSLKKGFAAAMFELGSAYLNNGQSEKALDQVTALKALGTSEGTVFASDLKELIRQPKIIGIDAGKSTFNTVLSSNFGPIPLLTLDPLSPELTQANGSKEFSMTFVFDSKMDTASVMNPVNWRISKANDPRKGGMYDNGLYRPTDTAVPTLPTRVSYDPVAQEATVFFSVSQKSDISGTIDPSRIVFSFLGTDITGKKLDSAANEYDGYAAKAF